MVLSLLSLSQDKCFQECIDALAARGIYRPSIAITYYYTVINANRGCLNQFLSVVAKQTGYSICTIQRAYKVLQDHHFIKKTLIKVKRILRSGRVFWINLPLKIDLKLNIKLSPYIFTTVKRNFCQGMRKLLRRAPLSQGRVSPLAKTRAKPKGRWRLRNKKDVTEPPLSRG